MDAFNLQPSFMSDTETLTYGDNLIQVAEEGFNMHNKTFIMHNKLFSLYSEIFEGTE